MCSFSVGRAAGVFGCLLLLVGLVAPLYTINLVVVEQYPVTAAYAVYAGRDLILVFAGVLTMLCMGLLYTVISHQVQALAGSFAELGGGASTLFGGILSDIAGYLIDATVASSWGWYLFFAAGVVLIAAGILGAVMKRRVAQ